MVIYILQIVPKSPFNVVCYPDTKSSILLKWENGESYVNPIESYVVYMSTDSGLFVVKERIKGIREEFLIKELTENSVYRFRMSAKNSIGYSILSESTVNTTTVLPSLNSKCQLNLATYPPTDLKISIEKNIYTLTWKYKAEVDYNPIKYKISVVNGASETYINETKLMSYVHQDNSNSFENNTIRFRVSSIFIGDLSQSILSEECEIRSIYNKVKTEPANIDKQTVKKDKLSESEYRISWKGPSHFSHEILNYSVSLTEIDIVNSSNRIKSLINSSK